MSRNKEYTSVPLQQNGKSKSDEEEVKDELR